MNTYRLYGPERQDNVVLTAFRESLECSELYSEYDGQGNAIIILETSATFEEVLSIIEHFPAWSLHQA